MACPSKCLGINRKSPVSGIGVNGSLLVFVVMIFLQVLAAK